MTWDEIATAAQGMHWTVAVATCSPEGLPHVAIVSPGLAEEGRVWFASHGTSTKIRNLRSNPNVALHWPVLDMAKGQLFMRGVATIHDDAASRHRLWAHSPVPYNLGDFFSGPDDDNLVFVEVAVSVASLMPSATEPPVRWQPTPSL